MVRSKSWERVFKSSIWSPHRCWHSAYNFPTKGLRTGNSLPPGEACSIFVNLWLFYVLCNFHLSLSPVGAVWNKLFILAKDPVAGTVPRHSSRLLERSSWQMDTLLCWLSFPLSIGPLSSSLKDVAETSSAWLYSLVLAEADGGVKGGRDAISLIKNNLRKDEALVLSLPHKNGCAHHLRRVLARRL